MPVRVGIVAVMLAACQVSAADVVVYPPSDPSAPPVDHVELRVGVDTPGSGSLILDQRINVNNATWWTRDPGTATTIVAMAGQPVTFQIDPGSPALSTAIAIGYTNNVPTSAVSVPGVTIPSDAIGRFVVGLDPAADFAHDTPYLGENLHVWGPTGGAASCAAVVDSGSPTPTLIVEADDPDCDGFPTSDTRTSAVPTSTTAAPPRRSIRCRAC